MENKKRVSAMIRKIKASVRPGVKWGDIPEDIKDSILNKHSYVDRNNVDSVTHRCIVDIKVSNLSILGWIVEYEDSEEVQIDDLEEFYCPNL